MGWITRLQRTLRSRRLERDLDEELRSHLEEACERGRDPEEVRRAFGSALRWREEGRDAHVLVWLDTLLLDAKLGLRRLLAARAVTTVMVVSLALATGSCLAAYQLADALLLRPLPVDRPGQLRAVAFGASLPEWPTRWTRLSYPGYLRLERLDTPATLFATTVPHAHPWTVRPPGTPRETVEIQYVSSSFFGALGLAPSVGRLFAEDDFPDAPRAVITQALWRQLGAPQIGTLLHAGAEPVELVGVTGPAFRGVAPGDPSEIFLPAGRAPGVELAGRNSFQTFLRLDPGASSDVLQAQLFDTWRRFEAERWNVPGIAPDLRRAYLASAHLRLEHARAGASAAQDDYGRALAVLSGLAAVVLLIACVNVAHLMTSQALTRQRELSLRAALGAGRLRLLRMMLLESAWLSLAAVLCGSLLARWLAPALLGQLASSGRFLDLDLAVNARVLLFAAGLAIVVSVLCALVPAGQVRWAGAAAGSRSESRTLRGTRALDGLLFGQVFFCTTVLFVAGLLITSFGRLTATETGFDAEGVLAVQVRAEDEQPPALWSALVERTRTVPGVERVAMTDWPLLSGSGTTHRVEAGAPRREAMVEFLCVSSEWPEVLGIPRLEGSGFAKGIAEGSASAVLINRSFARHFFADQPTLGQALWHIDLDGRRIEYAVSGVVGDVRQNDLRAPPPLAVYVPCAGEADERRRHAFLLVRGSEGTGPWLAEPLRSAVEETDMFRVRGIETQKQVVQRQTAVERLLALLATYFGTASLLLFALGLYGVLHFLFARRRRELSLRIALGGRGVRLLRDVLARTGLAATLGCLAGTALGPLAGRGLEALLFDVSSRDPASFATPIALVALAGAVAAGPVLRRALSTDPAESLRTE
ncbi:MAG: ABC transporter permease [Acidobacteriota bacterium]